MTTANDLIQSAALKLGAKATGESLTADEAKDSLSVLNSMLDYWSINKLLIYQIVQDTYAWTANTASKTFGSSTRPIKIEEGSFFRSATDNVDVQVTILRNRATYDGIASKDTTSTYPEYIFYDPAYPLGVLYVYPKPSGSLTLYLNTWKALQNFASLTTELSLPPGYKWAIENNLAIALEPVFSVAAPSSVVKAANLSLKSLIRSNHIPVVSSTETAYVLRGNGRPDIQAGH